MERRCVAYPLHYLRRMNKRTDNKCFDTISTLELDEITGGAKNLVTKAIIHEPAPGWRGWLGIGGTTRTIAVTPGQADRLWNGN